jgi:DNA-directed RNA polymerase subunit H
MFFYKNKKHLCNIFGNCKIIQKPFKNCLKTTKMHTLQPKHTKLKKEELAKLLVKFNLSLSQLPKISQDDAAIPENCEIGDVLKIERKTEDGFLEYFRVIV